MVGMAYASSGAQIENLVNNADITTTASPSTNKYYPAGIVGLCTNSPSATGKLVVKDCVMNGKMIESPKSFQVACTVMTQIIAAVASNQYGGQSVNVAHLGKYLRKSRDKFEKETRERFSDTLDEKAIREIVDMRVDDELKSGVQTIQYQINTLMTTNGQSPFVTLFLYIDENDEYVEENVRIIEEILRQRLEGI